MRDADDKVYLLDLYEVPWLLRPWNKLDEIYFESKLYELWSIASIFDVSSIKYFDFLAMLYYL